MINFLVFVYNEQENVMPALSKIKSRMDRLGYQYRIIVVDDGSTDKTIERLQLIKPNLPLEIVRNNKNMGVASAFRRGLEAIQSSRPGDDDAVITWEGDNTMNPALIDDLLNKWKQGYELVCASRFISGGRSYNFFSMRFLLSRTGNFILKILFPTKGVNDYTHFARLYRWNILRKLLSCYNGRLIQSKDFAFNTELLLKIRKMGARIIQIPHIFQYDLRKGRSKFSLLNCFSDHLLLTMRMI